MRFPNMSGAKVAARLGAVLGALRRGAGIFVALLILIWVVLPLLPKGSGLQFGMGYRAFFTAMLLLGALFSWFLGKERISFPRSSGGVLASLAAVYLLTIGALVLAGVVYPQFQRPLPPGAAEAVAAKRGERLFWSETGKAGCFRCHAIEGRGGTRGPDLTRVASRAGERVSGMTAEQYLLEKVAAGATYQFRVPEYAPLMPRFGPILSEEQVRDLIAYLLSLELK